MSLLSLTTKLIEWKSNNDPDFSALTSSSESNENDGNNEHYHMNNIILQDQNGPCFIISLINLLLLKSELLESQNRKLLALDSSNNDEDGWTTVVSSKKLAKAPINSPETKEMKSAVLQDNIKKIKSRIESTNGLKELVSSKTIKYDQLINELIYALLIVNQQTGAGGEDISEIIEELHSLETGLNVNVRFNDLKIDDFGSKSNTINKLLNILDVDVVHGFIAEDTFPAQFNSFDKSQEFLVSVVESYQEKKNIDLDKLSIDDLIELKTSDKLDEDLELDQFIKLKIFLNENRTQLTQLGLNILKTDRSLFPNNTFKLFFRNDHFNTLYKADDQLYLLINDQGYSKNKEIVWQSLNSINGDRDEYLTGLFDIPSRRILKKSTSPETAESSIGNTDTARTASNVDGLTKGMSETSLTDRMLEYDYSYLDEDDPTANPFAESKDQSSDAALARALQAEEDEKTARRLQKSYNSSTSKSGGAKVKSNSSFLKDKKSKKKSKSKGKADVLDTGASEKEAKKSQDNCIIV